MIHVVQRLKWAPKEKRLKLLQKIEFRMTQHCATIFVPINDPCSIEFNILDNNI